jgi:hypothetical protein
VAFGHSIADYYPARAILAVSMGTAATSQTTKRREEDGADAFQMHGRRVKRKGSIARRKHPSRSRRQVRGICVEFDLVIKWRDFAPILVRCIPRRLYA